MSAPLDLRLVPAMLAAWLAAAVLVVLPAPWVLAAGIAAGCVPLCAAARAARRRGTARRDAARRDLARRDLARRDPARGGTARRDLARRGTARRDPARPGAARRGPDLAPGAVGPAASPTSAGHARAAVSPGLAPPPAAAAGRRTRWRRSAAGQVVLTSGVIAGVLLAGASQLAARDAGGMVVLAASGATVTLSGTLTSEPAPVRSGPPGTPPRYRATVAVDDVETRGRHRAASAPVTVLTGSPWPEVSYGARVAVRGRLLPGAPGRRAVALLRADGVAIPVEPPGVTLQVVDAVRSGLRDVCTGLGADARGLVPGIAVGDTSALPDDLEQAMRDSGLTHVTAVSGAHFSIVGAGVLVLTGALGLPRRGRAAVVGAVMLGFVVLVHPGPSVLRAAAMGAVGLGALVLGRPARSVPALAAAVVVLLVADPWLARELGFVLSVVATSGLVLLAGPLARRWSGSARAPVAYALAVPVAAQSVCAPVVLLLSPTVALYAVPANVLVAPAVAPATVLGLLAALVSPWWHAAGVVLAELAGLACWWIATVARVAASLPGAQVAWTPGLLGAILLAAGTTAGLVLLLGRPPGDVDHGVGTATERARPRRRVGT